MSNPPFKNLINLIKYFVLKIPIVLHFLKLTFLPFGQEVPLAFSSVNSDFLILQQPLHHEINYCQSSSTNRLCNTVDFGRTSHNFSKACSFEATGYINISVPLSSIPNLSFLLSSQISVYFFPVILIITAKNGR